MLSYLRPQSAVHGRPQPKRSHDHSILRPKSALYSNRKNSAITGTKSKAEPVLRKSHLQAPATTEVAVAKSSEEEKPQEFSTFPSPKKDLNLLEIIQSGIVLRKSDSDFFAPSIEEKSEHEPKDDDTPHPTFHAWLAGSPHPSEDFDTDVEEEEEEEKRTPKLDPTGILTYENQCQKNGFIPISYLCRHLGDRDVRMRHRYLGGESVRPLALALKQNTVTERLNLSNNCIEETGTQYLSAMLKENNFISTLNLSNNSIGHTGVEALGSMLEENTSLKSLSIAGNRIADRDALALIDALKNNSTLVTFDLSHNNLSVMGGIHIAGGLAANDGLVDVDLSWNCLRKSGAEAVANSLKQNRSIEFLDLSWNGFGLEGVTVLQTTLQINTTLRSLDLTNNRIDEKAAEKLSNGLKKNTGLKTLILSMNPLGDKGVESILGACKLHPTLCILGIEEISITENNYMLISSLTNDRLMLILHSGVGGYCRSSATSSAMKIFNWFLPKNYDNLLRVFVDQDKDETGILHIDEIKSAFRRSNFYLTNTLFNALVEDIDSSHSGYINYRDLLSGQAFSEYSRRRISRHFVNSKK